MIMDGKVDAKITDFFPTSPKPTTAKSDGMNSFFSPEKGLIYDVQAWRQIWRQGSMYILTRTG
jgi:hypothetical protein